MKIITSRDQIPEHMSDAEAAEFWSNHAMSDELLEDSIIEEEDYDLPRRKSTTISIHLDEDLLQRLNTLAKQRNKDYQTLIKQFLIERTYEEEKKGSTFREDIPLSLANFDQYNMERQLESAFGAMQEELSRLVSGTIFLQIRNNHIVKFGIRFQPLGKMYNQGEVKAEGLTELQQRSLLKHATEALKNKTNWKNGEITFNFSLQNNELQADFQFESNYNISQQFKLKSN
ncbi:BrnA antitoxin family protein [Paenibacillus sp. N1-5-1-14]|uniref:BrnA antitoxin family protein n=1 Tax=Paenibacillus radicibacter TaxID=2972488 RepID=UPI0021592C1B|nr:BrnA antitoxin family protein [Paenibacillus radicibacter]MCR8643610.1 BrnA antitoxin family protein [Paenibacillus radicibacter]